MTVCPEFAILADAHTGWLGLEQSLKPAFPAYSQSSTNTVRESGP